MELNYCVQVTELQKRAEGTKFLLNWSFDKITEMSASRLVSIVSTQGREITARYCVCTVPLGVLKSLPPDWIQPPLPARVKGSIERLQMCKYNKVFLHVDPDVLAARPTWSFIEDDIFWQGFSYYQLTGKPVYVLMSIDERVETMSDSYIKEQAMSAAGFQKHHVRACHITRWCSVPWSQGAYSYVPTECELDDIDVFTTEMKDRRVRFAGEHCDEEYQGSLHGAYDSGVQTANAILDCSAD